MKLFSGALDIQKGDRLALVGGGGKTSLMYTLAGENLWGRTFCTTTTKMFDPRRGSHPFSRVEIPWKGERLPRPRSENEICYAAGSLSAGGKVNGLSYKSDSLWKGDSPWPMIIIEADGAAGRPLKVPGAHEPCIPGGVNKVVACVGLDVLGKPAGEEWVHRFKLFSERLSLREGTPVQPEHLETLIAHREGFFSRTAEDVQKILFLNKCDAPGMDIDIQEIVRRWKKAFPRIRILAGSLRNSVIVS